MVDVPPPPAAAVWKMRSANQGSACVQVASDPAYVWVRDSKDLRGPVLGFTCPGWAVFVAGVQRGEFDRCIAAA
jgi:hypothetical protein